MFSAEVQVMVSFMRDSSMTGQRLRRGSIRRMLSYARPYRLQVSIYLAMTVLSAAMLTAIPVLLQTIIDHGILRRDTAVVLWTAAAVAGLAAANALLAVGQRWYSARVGEGLIYDLRTEVFGHVQRQPVAFFTRAQTGSLVSRLNGDIISAQQALTSTLAGVVSNIVSLVLALTVMLWLSWPVTVVTTLTGLQAFTQVYVLTQGGPDSATQTALYYVYDEGFVQFDTGRADAMGVLLFGLSLLVATAQIGVLARGARGDR